MSERGLIDRVFTTLIHDIDGARAALDMRRSASLASAELQHGDPPFVGPEGTSLRANADALRILSNALYIDARNRTRERAAQYGWLVATYVIAPVARGSGEQAVVWLTGNSYMPPIRDLADAERLWSALDANTDHGHELWEAFIERLDSRLSELNVLMEAPEYDNALYVVDLARFEHIDEDELARLEQATASAQGELTLEDEWRAIATEEASPSEG